MDGANNYIAIGALAAAAGSYAYTYSQVQNIQKEITKISESINKTNDGLKTYDENIKESLTKVTDWSKDISKDIEDLHNRITMIEDFLAHQLRYPIDEKPRQ